MLEPDFLVLDSIGLYCKAGNFYIDPQTAVPLAVVSHAHADHAVPGSVDVYSTPGTMDLMRCRYGKKAAKYAYILPYGELFNIKDVRISFHPAGHILGSAQILLEYKGIRYLYTGDFKTQADSTCEPYSFVKADVLITETTFADPAKAHPDEVQEIQKLNSVNQNVLLGAYALGKAQRLTALINQHCPDKVVLLHHSISPFHRIYEQFGSQLKWQFYDRKLMKQQQNYVYIVPPMTYRSYLKAIDVKRFFATGWAKPETENNQLLLISDHADWRELMLVIEQTEPREIWTLHGDGSHVATYFADKDVLVKALN